MGALKPLDDRSADRVKDCRTCAAKVAFYIGTHLMNRKVCTDDRKYQRLAATNRFRTVSGIPHNYFACNASPSVVITFHHFNRSIRRIVLAREMAMECIHLEVPEMRSHL